MKTRNRVVVVAVCATLLLAGLITGCSRNRNPDSPLAAMASPAIPPAAQEISNPLRGQYEDLMQPLFPQGEPVQRRYPAWPASYDASLRVSWRQLQPVDPVTLPPDAPDDARFDFSAIDDALNKLAERGMRLTLRVYAYNSCCNSSYPDNTNIAIPDWVRAIPSTNTSYTASSKGSTPGVTHVVPNFNDPTYLDDFGLLLAALGRRYDGDERLSVFEFSGYGDSSENHIAFLRDVLNAAGPGPDESAGALGYYSQYRDQNITTASIQKLVAANVNAFPRTQLVVTPNNPEIVRELLADDVTTKLAAPVGIRSDCLGVNAPLPTWAETNSSHYVQTSDPLVAALKQRMATAPVITEWCQLPNGTTPHAYYEKGLRDVIRYHVSMTSSINFPDQQATSPMDPKLYVLWAQANAVAGYRYSVEARQGSQALQDNVATIGVTWTNYGAAAATEKWVPGYRLVDFSGRVVRNLPANVDLKKLVTDQPSSTSNQPTPASTTETVRVELKDLPPGHYTLRAVIEWQQHKPNGSHVVHYPPMHLARDGRDESGFYPIATLDIGRDVLTSTPKP
ncbi:hypothetical protein BST27_17620 [Mycobacterium intermedium]|uniref:DUF4832 domain-containing protein n=1 Tax=Mycobacterium intermedium TaxID=28445 RepID=A0A1E3SIU4_MYCIE|nr:hypothetical protein [Mycobacterium intermedium]MCV6963257.1 hypothetical protein [Mycobacterium intermedium]ODR01478.1 hypothetical protein BHQ20_08265 [Mycobacterium intermedium]OPE47331.1 hypothetical protein BV508_22500 [Mycobacterium intermedium]ORB01223.1 hypothetical protein BST27_17620 [Mycobacterium intermedium]